MSSSSFIILKLQLQHHHQQQQINPSHTGRMTNNSIPSDMRLLAVCTLLLYVKFLVTTMIQGHKAFSAGTRAPEDNELPMAKGHPVQVLDIQTDKSDKNPLLPAIEDELRWKRIVQNDLESMPLAFVVFITSVLAGGHMTVNSVALVTYTVARYCHTATYACRLPLARMLSWMCGISCVLVAGVNGLVASAMN